MRCLIARVSLMKPTWVQKHLAKLLRLVWLCCSGIGFNDETKNVRDATCADLRNELEHLVRCKVGFE